MIDEQIEKLCSDHWVYVKNFLLTGGLDDCPKVSPDKDVTGLLRMIEFHYKNAMAHGFKHGVQWAYEQLKLKTDEEVGT